VRARNSFSYLTARRFSAQDRVNAIRAIKRLKADAGERETGLAAAEIALLWLRVSGNHMTVSNIAAGHSGGTVSAPGWRSPSPSGSTSATCKSGRRAARSRPPPYFTWRLPRHRPQRSRQEETFPALIASGGFRDIAIVTSVDETLAQLTDWGIPLRGRIAA
jgi:hypothetical protein